MESQSASVWVPSRELAALSLPVHQLSFSRVLFRASLQCFVFNKSGSVAADTVRFCVARLEPSGW